MPNQGPPQIHPEYENLASELDVAPYAFQQLDAWGKVYHANSLGSIPRHREVVSDLGFIRRLGHGFSVFNLGKVAIQAADVPAMARAMAAVLPASTPRGTMVQLVQVNQQHLSLCEATLAVPTLLMIIWGGCYGAQTDGAVAYAVKQRELMQAQRAKLEADDLQLQQQYKEQVEAETESSLPADWLIEFRELYPLIELDPSLVFTYDKLATCQPITRLYTQAQINRRTLAAQMLAASGLEVDEEKLYNPDKSQLYFWFDQTTTLMQLVDQAVLFAESYNVAGSNAACVLHSPCRGVDIYMRDFAHGGELSELDKQSHAIRHGAPLLSPGVYSPSPAKEQLSPVQLFEHYEEAITKLDMHQQMKEFVTVSAGSVMPGGQLGTKFMPLDACDSAYGVLNPLQYSGCFREYKVLHCSTVLCVLPSPLEVNDKLYGVTDPDLKRMLLHVHPRVEHFTFPNTDNWVNQLTRISPGKAPFTFMNQETAVIDENTDEIVAFKVPKELIEAKAKF